MLSNIAPAPTSAITPPPTEWTGAIIARIQPDLARTAPIITAIDAQPILADLDVWDMWPLAAADGTAAAIATIAGTGTLWFALAAPKCPDPIDRHGLARIRLLWRVAGTWHDAGNALPDMFAPGSREWSGSALLDADGVRVHLFFTAAGARGETILTVQQRLFHTTGQLNRATAVPRIDDWQSAREIVVADDDIYLRVPAEPGLPGHIKAFRDPGIFCNPADGKTYLVFAASIKAESHRACGAVGLAVARDASLEHWDLLAPIITAIGVTDELERPHLLFRAGRFYVFWSTQNQVFAQGGPAGPTGLYGMVAEQIAGPYCPLNGDSLVIANPPEEKLQAYSWWVLGDGSVISFIDYWGLQGRSLADHPALIRSQFGGVPAPVLQLRIEGETAILDQPD